MQFPGDSDIPDEYTNYAPDWLSPLEAMLKERNEGRRPEFIFGYGGKDSDLDSDGTCGIKKVEPGEGNTYEDAVTVTVSGHVTFHDPSYESEIELCEDSKNSIMDVAHSIVCDAMCDSGDWTGDDWCFYFETTVQVEVPLTNNDVDMEALFTAVVEAFEKAAEPYEESWAETNRALDELEEDMPNYELALNDQSVVQ